MEPMSGRESRRSGRRPRERRANFPESLEAPREAARVISRPGRRFGPAEAAPQA